MARHLLLIHMISLSLLLGDGTVQIQLTNGQEVQGEFIGTYMDHVHVLTEEKLYYYACDDIRSILSPEEEFDYDCSENTVTADILFPPELDPMTGEWAQRLPDVFNPDIVQPIATTEADAVDTVPPTVDLGEVDPRFDEEVSTFEKKDVTEEDFIIINGVKYVRAAPDKETDQDNLPRTTKKKKSKKKREGQLFDQDSIPITTIEEVKLQAQQAAQQMERKFFHQFLGVGSCLFYVIGLPASILYVEFLADSKMDPGNPFYMALDPGQKVVYDQYYKKEEKRLRRKGVYGTELGCILITMGIPAFLLIVTG